MVRASNSHTYRVLYDGMIFHRQNSGGINRYFEKLIDYLPENVEPSLTLSRCPSNNFPQSSRLRTYVKKFALPRPFRKVSRLIRAARFESLRKEISPDLIHATYYDTLGGCEKLQNGPPLVVTVHDMTHEKFPHLVDRSGKHAKLKARAIRRADAIICVSQKTRSDLLERFPECESRTSVIYHATELGKLESDHWIPPSGRPYLLYVGSRASYKNFDGLLKALKTVILRNSSLQLRVVGKRFSKSETNRIAALGLIGNVINHGLVTDRRLAQLFRQSELFVYPSLYEGFGLPLLEAMSCDTPVLASNTSSIPEVVQGAAMLFDPSSETDLTDAIEFLLDNRCVCEQLVSEGRLRCQQFSWTKSADQTLEVYRSVLATSQIRIGNLLSNAHVDEYSMRSRLPKLLSP